MGVWVVAVNILLEKWKLNTLIKKCTDIVPVFTIDIHYRLQWLLCVQSLYLDLYTLWYKVISVQRIQMVCFDHFYHSDECYSLYYSITWLYRDILLSYSLYIPQVLITDYHITFRGVVHSIVFNNLIAKIDGVWWCCVI